MLSKVTDVRHFLPFIQGTNNNIDIRKAKQMLEEAMQGVNIMKEPAPSEEAKESSDTSSEDQAARIMGYNTE